MIGPACEEGVRLKNSSLHEEVKTAAECSRTSVRGEKQAFRVCGGPPPNRGLGTRRRGRKQLVGTLRRERPQNMSAAFAARVCRSRGDNRGVESYGRQAG